MMSFLRCIDSSWTLFLDRDGTINKKIEGGYVLRWDMFEFLEGAKEAIALLSTLFKRVIVVTNQRGIGKGLMGWHDLEMIHACMKAEIESVGGRIDGVFVCPHDYEKETCNCRKPDIGLALKAKDMFPEIDFSKSVVIGDQISDIQFAKNLGALGVLLTGSSDNNVECDVKIKELRNFYDLIFSLKYNYGNNNSF